MLSNKEINEEMRKLTAAVFRVTEKFSHSGVLKNKIQEKALNIFSQCNPHFNEAVIKDINILKNFLRLARDLRLTKEINCEVLIKEYSKLISQPTAGPAQWRDNFSAQGGSRPMAGQFPSLRLVSRGLIISKQNPNFRNTNQEEAGERAVGVSLTGRQKQIFDLFRNKNELRLKEISKNFSQLTSRTLRNDLRILVESGILKHEGMGAGSIYRFKSEIRNPKSETNSNE